MNNKNETAQQMVKARDLHEKVTVWKKPIGKIEFGDDPNPLTVEIRLANKLNEVIDFINYLKKSL